MDNSKDLPGTTYDLSNANLNDKNVVNCIRWLTRKKINEPNFSFTKNDIASILNIQWATVSNIITKNLRDYLVSDKEDTLKLCNDKEYYIGISLGSSRIKVVAIDYNFNSIPLTKEIKKILLRELSDYIRYIDNSNIGMHNNFETLDEKDIHLKLNMLEKFELCFNIHDRQSKFISVFSVLNDICKFVVKLKEETDINICSVGFAFPGIVDYDTKTIKNSHLLNNMNDLTLKDLIIDEDVYNDFIKMFKRPDDSEYNYIFDQNSNAACVAEKELGNVARALQGKENLLVIYGGYGYGVGLVLNNKLFLGTKRGGQLGHIQVKPFGGEREIKKKTNDINAYKQEDYKGKNDYEILCRCGRRDCLENRINVDVFGRTLLNEEEFKAKSVSDHCKVLEKSEKAREQLSDYLSQAIYTLSQLFGAENIVLTGKLTEYYKEIQNVFKNVLFSQYSINPQNVKPSILGEFAAAKGIAIESYYYKNRMPLEWK